MNIFGVGIPEIAVISGIPTPNIFCLLYTSPSPRDP